MDTLDPHFPSHPKGVLSLPLDADSRTPFLSRQCSLFGARRQNMNMLLHALLGCCENEISNFACMGNEGSMAGCDGAGLGASTPSHPALAVRIDTPIMLRDEIPRGKLLPGWWARFLCEAVEVGRLLDGSQDTGACR